MTNMLSAFKMKRLPLYRIFIRLCEKNQRFKDAYRTVEIVWKSGRFGQAKAY